MTFLISEWKYNTLIAVLYLWHVVWCNACFNALSLSSTYLCAWLYPLHCKVPSSTPDACINPYSFKNCTCVSVFALHLANLTVLKWELETLLSNTSNGPPPTKNFDILEFQECVKLKAHEKHNLRCRSTSNVVAWLYSRMSLLDQWQYCSPAAQFSDDGNPSRSYNAVFTKWHDSNIVVCS